MRRCRVDEASPTSSIKPRAPRQLLPRVLSRSRSPRSPGGQAPGQASRAALGTACGRQRRAAAAARSAAPGAPTSRDGLWAPPPRGRGSSPVFPSTCQACRGHQSCPCSRRGRRRGPVTCPVCRGRGQRAAADRAGGAHAAARRRAHACGVLLRTRAAAGRFRGARGRGRRAGLTSRAVSTRGCHTHEHELAGRAGGDRALTLCVAGLGGLLLSCFKTRLWLIFLRSNGNQAPWAARGPAPTAGGGSCVRLRVCASFMSHRATSRWKRHTRKKTQLAGRRGEPPPSSARAPGVFLGLVWASGGRAGAAVG